MPLLFLAGATGQHKNVDRPQPPSNPSFHPVRPFGNLRFTFWPFWVPQDYVCHRRPLISYLHLDVRGKCLKNQFDNLTQWNPSILKTNLKRILISDLHWNLFHRLHQNPPALACSSLASGFQVSISRVSRARGPPPASSMPKPRREGCSAKTRWVRVS